MSEQLDLTVHQSTALQAREPRVETENVLAVIARAAADPSVDVAKMQALLDMHERMVKGQAEREFKAALSAIQAVAPRVAHDGKIVVKGNLRSTYATFEAIDEALRPLTSEHGFSYRFTTEQLDTGLCVIMTVAHRSGHSEMASLPLPIDANDYRSAIQNVRSSITFAKRCLVTDFFNIVTVGEDRDGAGGFVTPEQVKEIGRMLRESGADMGRFFKFIGADSVANIPASHYDRAVSELRRKLASQQERQQ